MATLEIRFPDGLTERKELRNDRTFVIGQDETADLVLSARGTLPRHVVIRFVDHRYRLEADPAAKNVFVGVSPVQQLRLKPDANFSIGDVEFRVRYSPDELGTVLVPTVDEPAVAEATPYQPALYRSRAFLGIVAGLAVLALLSVGLYFLVRQRTADRLLEAANRDLSDGVYDKAITNFGQFLDSFPDDPRAPEARYQQAKARVTEITSRGDVPWSQALAKAEEFIRDVGKTPAFQSHPTEITDMILGIARGLADKARQQASPDALRQAETALALAQKAFPDKPPSPDALGRVQTQMEEAKLAVAKGGTLAETLERMEKNLTTNEPIGVYAARTELARKYPDLAADKRIAAKLAAAVTKERDLATFEPFPSVTPTPLGPLPSSWVQVGRQGGPLAGTGSASLVLGGTLHGIDASTGNVTFRLPLGDSLAFRPVRVQSSLVVYRELSHEILLLDAASGDIRGTLALGDYRPKSNVEATLFEDYLFIVAVKKGDEARGRVLILRAAPDKLAAEGVYVLPQPVVTPVEVDPARRSLLIVGEQATLFSASLDRRSIERTIPIGHQAAAVKLRPLVAGRFLFLSEYLTGESTRLRIFIFQADGNVKESNPLDIAGLLTTPPAIRTGRLFLASDRGEIIALDLGAETDREPWTKAASFTDADTKAGVPPLVRAVTADDFWILTDRARHYRVLLDRKSLEIVGDHELPGAAWQESEVQSDKLLVVSSNQNRGGASLYLLAGNGQKVGGQIQLGEVPLGIQPVLSEGSTKLLVALATGRHLLAPDLFVKETIQPVDITNTTAVDRALLPIDNWDDGIVAARGKKLRWIPASDAPTTAVESINLPGTFLGQGSRAGEGVLLPTIEGYVHWVSPQDGKELSDPFAAPFEEGKPLPMIAVITADPAQPQSPTFATGGKLLFKLELVEQPTRGWRAATRAAWPDDFEATSLRLTETHLWGLAPKGIALLPTSTLANGTRLDLPLSPLALTLPDERLLIITQTHELHALRASAGKLETLWNKKLAGIPVGPPIIQGDKIYLALSTGTLVEHALANGAEGPPQPIYRPLLAGPWKMNNKLIVLATDGSIVALNGAEE